MELQIQHKPENCMQSLTTHRPFNPCLFMKICVVFCQKNTENIPDFTLGLSSTILELINGVILVIRAVSNAFLPLSRSQSEQVIANFWPIAFIFSMAFSSFLEIFFLFCVCDQNGSPHLSAQQLCDVRIWPWNQQCWREAEHHEQSVW